MIIDPITIKPDQTLQDAEDIMASYKISGVPVVDDNNILVGILTNRDMRFTKDFTQKAKDKMTSYAFSYCKRGYYFRRSS